jgi:predicted nucleotidyltransferase
MPADALSLDDLRTVLLAGPPLRLAVLFGSAAAQALRSDSDLDIAILPEDLNLSLGAELRLQAALARSCGRDVDLVRLDRAPTLVLWEVARYGVPLIEAGPFEFARFRARAASEYLDFAPALERAAALFRRRLAAEHPPAGTR